MPIAAVCLLPCLLAAEPKGYVCVRANGKISIDGRLDEPAWQNALWTDAFVDIEGDRKPKPPLRTRVKMLWDDEAFYIAAEMEEPHVWGTLTKHDSVIYHDPDFEVFLDPDGDNHDYMELEVNALNAEWDLLLVRPYRDGGPAQNSWEVPGLKTAVHIKGTLNDPGDRDEGWSVELALPWSALAPHTHREAPPRAGDQWRVNFSRVEWPMQIVKGKYTKPAGAKANNWVWSPQGVVDMHRPEMWGYVQFSEKPAGEDAFRPDESAPARRLLHQIYYAQKAFHKATGRYAPSLYELKLPPAMDSKPLTGVPSIRLNGDKFTASVAITLSTGEMQRWFIEQDSRIYSK
jgi:cellulose/xylan binding protein with CBM9 domain